MENNIKRVKNCSFQQIHILHAQMSFPNSGYIHFMVAIRSFKRAYGAFIEFCENDTIRSLLDTVSRKTRLDDENFFGVYHKDIRNAAFHDFYNEDFQGIDTNELAKHHAWENLYIDYIPK